jgi:type II secretory pathway pseudopilin PulG
MKHARRRLRRGAADDGGFSYVELVVAVMIMGIIVVPVFDVFTSVISGSSRAASDVEVDMVMQSVADRVNRAAMSCDYTPYAEAAAVMAGWPESAATVSHMRYAAGVGGTVTWIAGACPAGGVNVTLVQLVQVTMTDPHTGTTRTLQVVKSDV